MSPLIIEGPLYAVTNLNSASSQSTFTNNNENGNNSDDKIVYQRYLTPIDGLPYAVVETSLNSTENLVETDYTEPVTSVPVNI